MKIERMMRWFLSIFLSVLLVSPSALKVHAEEGPVYSLEAGSSIVLVSSDPGSTNSLTTVRATWTNEGFAYLLIESSKELTSVSMDGITATGGDLKEYAKGHAITVGATLFAPVKNNSFLTVARFPVAAVSSAATHTIAASVVGDGHELGEEVAFLVPKLEITITKEWTGGPKNPVTVHLNRAGYSAPIGTYELSTADSSEAVTDLYYTDGLGRVIDYSVTEDQTTVEDGYSVSVGKDYSYAEGLHKYAFTITNTYTRPAVDIVVEKKWYGDNKVDKPNFITLNLYYLDDQEVRVDVASTDVYPDTDGLWKHTFENQYKYDENYNEINYKVEEEAVPGFSTHIEKIDAVSFFVHNTELLTIEGMKTWIDDPQTSATTRPDSITVELYRNNVLYRSKTVMPDASGNWTYRFDSLKELDAEGGAYTYTIKEADVDGYTSSVNGYDLVNIQTMEIHGTKRWLDEMETEMRPDYIEVILLQNEEEYKTMKVMPDGEGNWKYSFIDLPKYDANGALYKYSIDEVEVDGYETETDGYDLTNIRTDITSVTGTKIWMDEPETEMRPESITVVLLESGEEYKTMEVTPDTDGNWTYTFNDLPQFDEYGVVYQYSIDELEVEGYETTVEGFDLINTRVGMTSVSGTKTWMDEPETQMRPEYIEVVLLQNEEEFTTMKVMPDQQGNWTYTFNDLPQFDEYGAVYQYSIDELEVEGYETTVEGFDLINTRVGMTSVSGTKIWMDEPETQIRPEYIEVILLQNEEEYKTMKVMPDGEWNWTYAFNELPQFDEYGAVYKYTIDELEVEGYVTTVEGYDLFNTRVGTTSVSGTKTWMDEPETEMRPESITVVLLESGEEYKTMEVTPDTDGNWTYTFNDLPQFDEYGAVYKYSIDELEVEGYETTVEGFDLINTRVGMTSVSGTKTWMDEPETEKRPEYIQVVLLQNEEGYRTMKVLPDEQGNWTYGFNELPQFDEYGMAYEYAIDELEVEGYETTVEGFDLINTRVGTTSVSGTKTWMDEPETEMRPEYIEVVLLQNDEKYETLEVMPDPEGNWTYTFSDLPEFDAEGKPYAYSIDELEVEGYLSTVDGYDLINTRTGSVSISGEKTWDDLSDRPEEITVLLLENGVEVDRMKVTPNASGAWLYTFLNQHEFDEEGIPCTYSVEELPVAGYETTVDGYDLHNRQQRGMIRILKTDNFNEPLEGGEFEIHDEKGVLVYSGISDENGIVEALLPLGTYKVMEVEAPEDFILDETPKMAVLDIDGEVIELSFVNDPEINELPDTGGDEDPEEEEPEEEDIKDKTEDEKPELPKTGGIHYSFWSLQGILLIMGGLLLLKRRKTA
ncbi:Cna B-type domain-containing protein [Proteiniclasticum sp. SCR006]|uniref:Cna B-type domain-containing protein n=1 Tax=Proteiniclasticum aestuarii TaxID=2817862 RepID=A0A939HBW4_9CLOT|nr:Cna B-type domain-containing protein [Proteiniclasticum aestuarii]MBO1265102.1 Cna B-type domain-containing protein [Proteiniclasticum aestuarii]